MAFVEFNPNPKGKRVGDCVVRAISKVLGISWEQAYTELALQGFAMSDIMTANNVWGAYLYDKGFIQKVIPNTCPDCYTVRDFCEEYPEGTYVLSTGSHAVASIDGTFFDSWDSGDELVTYVWRKE